MSTAHTVKLKKYEDINIEKEANAALTPGHLLQLMSTGKVRKHPTAGGNAVPKMFALEDELQGKEIDEDYAAGDRVQIWICQPGEVVNALLKDGENIAIGDILESAGDGTLQKSLPDYSTALLTIYHNQIVGIANEARDLTGSSGADAGYRISVTIV